MDSTQTIDCIEWCFGYGGNHLGLKRVVPRLRCIAASEIEGYALANMVSKMEGGLLDTFPIWSNCKTFPCELFLGLVDIFIASYPCQPFSYAGQRKGSDDPRHLWPFVRRAVEIIRPRAVFLENVDGHISLGLREVLTELALLGYRVENSRGEPTWGVFSATEIGAPHNRKRVFIYAERESVVMDNALRQQNRRNDTERFSSCLVRTGQLADPKSDGDRAIPTRSRKERTGASEPVGPSKAMVNAHGIGSKSSRQEHVKERKPQTSSSSGEELEQSEKLGLSITRNPRHGRSGLADASPAGIGVGQADSDLARREGCELESTLRGRIAHGATGEFCSAWHWPAFVSRPNEKQYDFEPPRVIEVKRGLGGGFNGRSAVVDRLRLLGNGVYPAAAAKAFITLIKRAII